MTKTVTLGEICEVNPSRSPKIDDKTLVTFLAMADVSEEGKITNPQTRTYEDVKKGFTAFREEDILVAKITPCFENGKGAMATQLVNGIGFGSTEFHVLRPKTGIFSDYVFYATRTPSFKERGKESMTGSAGQQRITTAFVSNYKIPLPPLPRQRQIAAMLDRADSLRQKDRQLLTHYDQLAQSTFMDLFGDPVQNEKGWPTESIRSLSSFITDGPFGSNLKTEHYRANGVRVIRLNNIGVGEFLDDNKAFVSEEHYQKVLKKNTCLPGDVVIGTLGEPNLRACIVPDYVPLAINKADCVLCKPNAKKITARYLTAVLNNPGTLSLASSSMRGQTRVRISMGQVAILKIAVPPIALQQQFTTLIDRIEHQKAMVQQQVTVSESLFQRLLQDSFGA